MSVEMKKPSTWAHYKALLRKDLAQELHTKEMITSMGLYALLVLVVYGASLAQAGSELDIQQMAGGLLWVVVLFTSLLGLNRSFSHEKENGCLESILLVPMDRSVIFLAKATSNLLFLLAVLLCEFCQPRLFLLHLELRHGQVFLRTAAFAALHIVVPGIAHIPEEIVLQNAVGFFENRLALCTQDRLAVLVQCGIGSPLLAHADLLDYLLDRAAKRLVLAAF